MPSSDPTAVIILSEIIAFESIILIGLLVFFFIRKKKNIKMLKEAINTQKKNIPDRTAALKSAYSKLPQLQGDNVDGLISNLVDEETKLFHHIFDGINSLDESFINGLEKEIHVLSSAYDNILNTTSSPEDSETTEEAVVPDIDSAIDDLLAEEGDGDADGDPALDLSAPTESEDGIEEMPDDLLTDGDVDATLEPSEKTPDDSKEAEETNTPTPEEK